MSAGVDVVDRVIPTRFESLRATFQDQVPTILVRVEEDIERFARIGLQIQAARQGKLVFLFGDSGSGKTTACYSLPIFLPDYFSAEYTLPPPYELQHGDIPKYIANSIPKNRNITVVSIDGRETPDIDPDVFRSLLMQLNRLLRDRPDLLLVWPVTDPNFANRAVTALRQFGGHSAFTTDPIITLKGVPREQFTTVLEKMLHVAGWNLQDAAVTWEEVKDLAQSAHNIGTFLDRVQALVAQRTSLENLGIVLPTLVFAVSSDGQVQEVCRGLRRADTYYIEAARLLMETRESNVAEWWRERQHKPQSSLPYVISSFNAQLVAISPSTVVYAVGLYGDSTLRHLAKGPQQNRGNARMAMQSTEFWRFFKGQRDFRRWGGQKPSSKTREAYARIQAVSKKYHKIINEALIRLALDAGLELKNPRFEVHLTSGSLQTDVVVNDSVAIEFHHVSEAECTPNKIAIYVLEKLREYAVDFGLASR